MKRYLTAIVLGLAATSAMAADDVTGWNAGIAATFAEYKFDDNSLDDSGAGVKFFGGYRFSKLLAIEGAYHNFGKFSEDLDPPNPGGEARADVDGFSLSAVFYVPVPSEDFEPYARAGYYFFDQQVLVDGAVAGSNSPEGLVLAAGTRLAVSDQFVVRAEGEWFNISDGKLWSVNLGFEYLFGGPGKKSAPAARSMPAPRAPEAPATGTEPEAETP